MARVTYVKAARQRYATRPVLDDNGQPIRVPVYRRNGDLKTTKNGRLVYMTRTQADKSKPLPPRKCGKCGIEIHPGDPYKWIKPKSGPYGGRKLFRCADCPTWQVWEYSSSLSAQLARIGHDLSEAIMGAQDPDDATSAAADAAEEVRQLAEDKREGASNIEQGFGHPTTMSEDLQQVAEDLEQVADQLDGTTFETDTWPCSECNADLNKVLRVRRATV